MNPPIKYSRQREAIVNFLSTRTDHPTAETVYFYIRDIIPNISLGTVYRNLNQLANAGQLLRITSNDKIDHFDANIHPHYHFNCEDCGAVIDLDISPSEQFITDAARRSNLNIRGASIMFYGKCDQCLNKQQ